jgi:hypothetical protein
MSSTWRSEACSWGLRGRKTKRSAQLAPGFHGFLKGGLLARLRFFGRRRAEAARGRGATAATGNVLRAGKEAQRRVGGRGQGGLAGRREGGRGLGGPAGRRCGGGKAAAVASDVLRAGKEARRRGGERGRRGLAAGPKGARGATEAKGSQEDDAGASSLLGTNYCCLNL